MLLLLLLLLILFVFVVDSCLSWADKLVCTITKYTNWHYDVDIDCKQKRLIVIFNVNSWNLKVYYITLTLS